MKEQIKEEQPIVYRMLENALKYKRVSHAYLFVGDKNTKKLDVALFFAKTIFCENKDLEKRPCEKCNICFQINNNSFENLQIINPENGTIKKEQIKDLQKEFSLTGRSNEKKVYIINEAEKLTQAAANSILKFLEEPTSEIYAILITENINQMLKTIVSRCTIITFRPLDLLKEVEFYKDYKKDLTKLKLAIQLAGKKDDIESLINDESFLNKIDKTVELIEFYENNKLEVLLELDSFQDVLFNEKEDLLLTMEIMNLFYHDCINFYFRNDVDIFDDYLDLIKKITSLNKIERVVKKLEIITYIKQSILSNVNKNLLLFKLFIGMEDENQNNV